MTYAVFVARGDYHNIGVTTLIEYNDAQKNFGEHTRLRSNGDDAEQTGNYVNIESVNERSKNIGYYAKVVDSKAVDNIGGWFEVTNTASSKTYGIYASVPSPTSTTSCSSWAGWFNGPCWSTGVFLTSDSTLKQNINDIVNPLAMLDLIYPKSYTYDTLAVPQLNLPKGTHYGVIAQELEQSFPQFVSRGIQPAKTDTNGGIIFPEKEIKSVNYNAFIPNLIGAVKQQQMQIDSLNNLILSCCAMAPKPKRQ